MSESPRARHLTAETLAERLWRRVEKSDGCWLWTGSTNGKGYGQIRIDETGRTRVVHRVAFELGGGLVPAGLTIDHLCRRRNCVNPAHMEVVTQYENLLRGDCPAAKNARKAFCKRGHPLSGENLMTQRDGHRNCRECTRAAAEKRGQKQIPS